MRTQSPPPARYSGSLCLGTACAYPPSLVRLCHRPMAKSQHKSSPQHTYEQRQLFVLSLLFGRIRRLSICCGRCFACTGVQFGGSLQKTNGQGKGPSRSVFDSGAAGRPADTSTWPHLSKAVTPVTCPEIAVPRGDGAQKR